MHSEPAYRRQAHSPQLAAGSFNFDIDLEFGFWHLKFNPKIILFRERLSKYETKQSSNK